MKKLIIGGAAIAVLGYLGVVGYLHQFDINLIKRTRPNF